MISDRWIDGMLAKAIATAGDLQPWQDYFEAKAMELKTILRLSGWRDAETILEIGCGNAFTSSLLSENAKMVEAFDLPSKDPVSHSPGIGSAREYLRRMGVMNVRVVAGSAEALPFEDKAFGLIFSEYALQYVANKGKALSEMRRVLRDDGAIIIVVPNFMERVFAPVMKFKYLAERLISRMIRSSSTQAETAPVAGAKGQKGKRTALLEHILLRPDGAYGSFAEEMSRHRAGSWTRLFEEKGFKVSGTFSTQILPVGIFDILGPSAVRLLSRQLHRLNMNLGDKPVIKHIGFSFGMIIVKGR